MTHLTCCHPSSLASTLLSAGGVQGEASDLHDGGWKAEQVQLLEALALELLDLLTQRLSVHLGRGLPHDRALDIAGKAQDDNVRIGCIAADLHMKRPLQSRSMLQPGLAEVS